MADDAPPSPHRSDSFPREDPPSTSEGEEDVDDVDGESCDLLSSHVDSPGRTTTTAAAVGGEDYVETRPSLGISAAAATVGSIRARDADDRRAGRRGEEDGTKKRRTRTAPAARPLQRMLDRSIRERRTNPPACEINEDDEDDDATEPLADAPAKFRDSYEARNANRPKNLVNIRAIIREQESALLISGFVETRMSSSHVPPPPMMDVGFETVEGIVVASTTTNATTAVAGMDEEFSPLTCPPSQPAWGWGGSDRLASRDDDDDDDDDDDIDVDDEGNGRTRAGSDVGAVAEGEEEEEEGGGLPNRAAIVEAAGGKIVGPVEFIGGTAAAGSRLVPALDAAAAVVVARKRVVATNKRGRGGGGGATALALAEEYDVGNSAAVDVADGGEDAERENEDETRRLDGGKRKRCGGGGRGGGITALALAVPDDLASLATTAKMALAACIGGKGGTIVVGGRADAASPPPPDDGEDGTDRNEAERCPRAAAASSGGVESSVGNDERPSPSGTTSEGRLEADRGRTGPHAVAIPRDAISSRGNDGPRSMSFSGTSSAERQSQSEPLLSSPYLEAAAPPPSSGSSAKAASTNDTRRTVNETILALRHEYDEMGKALMCPICRSTLKEAIILPCVHAFCNSCLKDYYNPPRRPKGSRGGRKGGASSPPRKPKAECPVCKTANPGKRSGEKCPHLDEIARAYKMLGRAFSFTPIRYAADIVMTQLDPTDNVNRGDVYDSEVDDEEKAVENENGDDDEEKKMPAHKRISPVHEFEQHLQLAKAVQAAFVEQAKSQSHPRISRGEELENQMKVRRYRQMAEEQQAVVRADEQTLNREVKRCGGKKHMLAAVTAAFAAEAELGNRKDDASLFTSRKMEQSDSKQTSADAVTGNTEFVETNTLAAKFSPESKNMAAATDISILRSTDASVLRSQEIHQLNMKHVDDEAKDGSTVGEELFCTAPDESQAVEYDTAREESQATWNASESKAIALSMGNARRSTGTVDTANSSPVILHDGNTVRKTRHENRSNLGVSFLCTDFVDDPTPRRPGKVPHQLNVDAALPIGATAIACVEVASGAMPAIEAVRHADKLRPISEGTIVSVQARTWPGINKPGGVARVTKIHPAADNGGNSNKYDVVYVLGGKENRVDESFITPNEADETLTIEECFGKSIKTGSMSAEKKRPTRHRRPAVKPDITSSAIAPASFPIYNDEELTHIPEDVLKWAGILPNENKKKGKATLAPDSPSKHSASKGKKRVLKESNIAKSKPIKKQMVSVKKAVKTSCGKEQRSDTVEAFRDLIRFMSNEQIVSLADARYSHLLSLDKKRSSTETHSTLYAVTSSLTDVESEMFDSLSQVLKEKSVILKATKDFNPEKTQICITTTPHSSESSTGPIDVVSQSRTLKVMRSALAGIPILTPRWMEACLMEGNLIAPSGVMCVRSLPKKKGGHLDYNSPVESFGVAKYAAAFHKKELTFCNHLLSGVSVMLCGGSAGSTMTKDLKMLLLHTGATIISSVSTASRLLTDMSKGEPVPGPFVFLCDDYPTNKTCGISDALLRQAAKLKSVESKDGKRSVLCVHFNWLFDSISCAIPLKADEYEPSAWKLAMESLCASSNN